MSDLRKVIPTIIISFALWSPHGGFVLAEELKGQVDSTKLQGTSSDNVIQGGIKNEATINPSLKVIPGQVRRYGPLRAETPQYFYPTGANLTQFHGSSQVPARDGSQSSPFLNNVEQIRGSSRIGHLIAPISSYTLTPGIGVMEHRTSGTKTYSSQSGVNSYVPGYEISKVTTHPSISSYVPGHEAQRGTTIGGITNFEATHGGIINRPPPPINEAIHGSIRAVSGPVTKEGITAYAPGYASVEVPTIRAALTSNTPGHSFFSPATISTLTRRAPAYEITIKTPRNGVVSWDSNYESTVVHPGLIKNTLGGMWYSNGGVRPEEGQRANAQALPFKPVYAEALVGPQARPLTATALGLPGMHQVANTEITWEEWYKRVARAVYSRWQNEDVGPGRATVSVTVTRDRMVAGKVVEFYPAADVERNVVAETSFKEAALKAVNLVSQFEIPEFPPKADGPAVTFEVDLKRDVDGPVGFDVAAIPDSKPAEASSELPALTKTQTEKVSEKTSSTNSDKGKQSKAKNASKSASKKVPADVSKRPLELQMETPEVDR